MTTMIRCQECNKKLHSLRSRAKQLCVACDPSATFGGVSAAEKWMRGVLDGRV